MCHNKPELDGAHRTQQVLNALLAAVVALVLILGDD